MSNTLKRIKSRVRWGRVLLVAAVVIAAVAVWGFLSPNDPAIPPILPDTTEIEGSVSYSPEDFVQNEKGFMTCLTREYATGIDVSEYQRDIDWEKVKEDGISFVFIRLGGRGTTEGNLYTDSMAESHYRGAKEAGLQVGMYFYAQAITKEEAEEEAAFVLEHVAGYALDLPFVYDWEWGGQGSRTSNMGSQQLTEITETFCQAISQGGLSPMIYFNESQGLDQLDLKRLSGYPFWLAMYDGKMDFPYEVDYWQYSATGHVAGIEGTVDLNIHLIS